MSQAPYKTFVPHPIISRGMLQHGDWRFKRYAIHQGPAIDDSVFEAGLAQVASQLPVDPPAHCPRLGFLLHHHALTPSGGQLHYFVLTYWWKQNELITRVVASVEDGGWEAGPAVGPCVWDMEVFWHERNAYIGHMLSGQRDEAGYLGDVFVSSAAAQRPS